MTRKSKGPRSNGTEYVAAVDSYADILCGDFSNKPVPREIDDRGRILHVVSGIFVYHSSSGQFLVQKRADSKETYPGYFTDSASGHVNPRSDLSLGTIKDEMCRELEEEMGVSLTRDSLRLWTLFHDTEYQEIKFVFIGQVMDDGLDLDSGEVDPASGWYHSSSIAKMLVYENFVPTVKGLWKYLTNLPHSFEHLYEILEPWQEFWTWFADLGRFIEYQKSHQGTRPAGLFIGRFQPFHNGHLACLKEIAHHCDDLVLGIGSTQYAREPRNPLTYGEREEITRKILQEEDLGFSNIFIIPIHDVHEENLWMVNIKEILGDNITMFSNNDWVRGLASKAGMDIGPKLEFSMNLWNGTRIRELIRNGRPWQDLVPQACKNILERRRLLQHFIRPSA